MVLFDIIETGKRITVLQEKLEVNSLQFAKAIGADPSFMNKVEKGKKSISKKYIEKIEEKFNVSRDWLLNGQGDMFKNGLNVPHETLDAQAADRYMSSLDTQRNEKMKKISDLQKHIHEIEAIQKIIFQWKQANLNGSQKNSLRYPGELGENMFEE